MIKLAILLIINVIVQQAYCDEPEKIVGGDVAAPGQFKYQVSLETYGEHFCGGTLISTSHVLTAAHCVFDEFYTNGMVVVTGTISPALGGERHKVKCIRIHPEYTGEREGGWKHDIAVLTLEKPIVENEFQGPIPLADRDYTEGGVRGIVSGWGKLSASGSVSPVLKYVIVNVMSQDRCLNSHKNPRTNENQICTLERVGKGACQGDSGGPLVVGGRLVGAVSWVIPCALGRSDVHTKIYKYLDFIKECQSLCR